MVAKITFPIFTALVVVGFSFLKKINYKYSYDKGA
jgi:hypothetical protein